MRLYLPPSLLNTSNCLLLDLYGLRLSFRVISTRFTIAYRMQTITLRKSYIHTTLFVTLLLTYITVLSTNLKYWAHSGNAGGCAHFIFRQFDPLDEKLLGSRNIIWSSIFSDFNTIKNTEYYETRYALHYV